MTGAAAGGLGRVALGWAGGHGGSVREGHDQLPVGRQGEFPACLVDFLVVSFAEGEQIVEVGGAVVFPPDDMVDAGVAVAHAASGYGAGGVEGT